MGEALTTIQAAQQARVTVATIRAWCRRGIITATKTGRRWAVDSASLARHRHTIYRLRTRNAGPRRTPTWPIQHACGHRAYVGWHRLTGATTRPCGRCEQQHAAQERRDAEDAVRATLADRYGHGRPASDRQLSYLRSLARRAAANHRLSADYPADHVDLLTSPAASHWIDTLKPLAAGRDRAARCDCPSGRLAGVCTC